MTVVARTAVPVVGLRCGVVVATLSLVMISGALSFTLVPLVLPHVAAQYETLQTGWAITLLSLVGAMVTPIAARIGDVAGKKRTMVMLIALATGGSLMAAFADQYWVFLTGRALQGLLLAVVPLGYSLMREVFSERGFAMGASILTTSAGLAGTVTPVVGGFLYDDFGLVGVFGFLALLHTLVLVLVIAALPRSAPDAQPRSALDLHGAGLLGIAVTCALLALSHGATWGWGNARTVVVFGAGVAAVVVWVGWERRAPAPIIPIPLLRSRGVAVGLAAGALSSVVITSGSIVIPLIAQVPVRAGHGYGFGMSPASVAVFTAPSGLACLIAGFLVGGIVLRVGPRRLMIVGGALMAIGFLVTAGGLEHVGAVVVGYVLVGLGSGAINGALPMLIAMSSGPRQQAVCAGALTLVQSIGAAFGAQLLVMVLSFSTVVAGVGVLYSKSGFVAAVIGIAVCAGLTVGVALFAPRGVRTVT